MFDLIIKINKPSSMNQKVLFAYTLIAFFAISLNALPGDPCQPNPLGNYYNLDALKNSRYKLSI